MKYLFLNIDLRAGEDEFTSKTVLQYEDDQDPQAVAEAYLMGFWGDATREDERWVEYPNGVIGSLRGVNEITEAEYAVLSRFI